MSSPAFPPTLEAGTLNIGLTWTIIIALVCTVLIALVFLFLIFRFNWCGARSPRQESSILPTESVDKLSPAIEIPDSTLQNVSTANSTLSRTSRISDFASSPRPAVTLIEEREPEQTPPRRKRNATTISMYGAQRVSIIPMPHSTPVADSSTFPRRDSNMIEPQGSMSPDNFLFIPIPTDDDYIELELPAPTATGSLNLQPLSIYSDHLSNPFPTAWGRPATVLNEFQSSKSLPKPRIHTRHPSMSTSLPASNHDKSPSSYLVTPTSKYDTARETPATLKSSILSRSTDSAGRRKRDRVSANVVTFSLPRAPSRENSPPRAESTRTAFADLSTPPLTRTAVAKKSTLPLRPLSSASFEPFEETATTASESSTIPQSRTEIANKASSPVRRVSWASFDPFEEGTSTGNPTREEGSSNVTFSPLRPISVDTFDPYEQDSNSTPEFSTPSSQLSTPSQSGAQVAVIENTSPLVHSSEMPSQQANSSPPPQPALARNWFSFTRRPKSSDTFDPYE